MGERLRCAVIGAGVAGSEWVSRLMRGPRTTVVAVCDQQIHRARELADRYRIPRVYAAFEQTVEQPDLDAVMVAVPTHLHTPVALAALNARKHVLVETPLALNAREAARLYDAAAARKCLLMPAQDLRFNRSAQTARWCVQHGAAGDVYLVRAFWRRHSHLPRPGTWRAQRATAGGGCLVDLGQPLLDLALHLVNDFQATQVLAAGHTLFGPQLKAEGDAGRQPPAAAGLFDVEDAGAAFIALNSRRHLFLETRWEGHFDPQAPELGLELLGTRATLRLFPARLCRPGTLGLESILLNHGKPPYPEDCAQHFAQCVLEDKKPVVTPQEALAVQRLVDAMVQSAGTGKPVSMKPS